MVESERKSHERTPMPADYRMFLLRMPEELLAKIRVCARHHRRSATTEMLVALQRYVDTESG